MAIGLWISLKEPGMCQSWISWNDHSESRKRCKMMIIRFFPDLLFCFISLPCLFLVIP